MSALICTIVAFIVFGIWLRVIKKRERERMDEMMATFGMHRHKWIEDGADSRLPNTWYYKCSICDIDQEKAVDEFGPNTKETK